MKTRTDLLNHLVDKHGLKRYLEIGVQVPEINFDKIKCRYKISVDPDPNAKATFCMTSDDFFNYWDPVQTIEVTIKDSPSAPQFITQDRRFDLIFIDGLHTAEQVKKDFENALKVLSPNGFIVLHDCNPLKEEHTIVPRPTERGHWNGSCYKFAVKLGKRYRVTVDIDNGCAVFRDDKTSPIYDGKYFNYTRMAVGSWEDFDKNRKEYLNLITWDDFVNL